jgi:hypothetical protein
VGDRGGSERKGQERWPSLYIVERTHMAIVDAPQSLKVRRKLRSCFGILVFRFGWVSFAEFDGREKPSAERDDSSHMTSRGAEGGKNGVERRQKRRSMSLKLTLCCKKAGGGGVKQMSAPLSAPCLPPVGSLTTWSRAW